MRNLELRKTISLLKGSYRTIDFRAAYYKHDGHWEYIISIMRFTSKTKEEVLSLQKKLEKNTETSDFKIESKALEIQKFEEYWPKICESAERNVKVISNDDIDSFINYIKGRRTSNYLLDIDKEYNSIQFTIKFKDLHVKHHERFQFIKKDLIKIGRKELYPLIEQALQIHNFRLNSPLYSIVLLPIYVKIDKMSFVNNYLSGDVIFHTFYEECKLHFILNYIRERSDEQKGFTLSTDREKIRWYRYEKLANNMFKIHFTVHFEKIRLNSLPEFYKLICRLSCSDLDKFLMDFEVILNEIYEGIKNRELIPGSVLKIIDPFLEINILDRNAGKNQSSEIIENMLNSRIEELKNIILENIDWFMTGENFKVMREFFLSAANRPASHYHNYYNYLIVNACDAIIKSELVEDINTKSRVNDLLIKYNYKTFDHAKFYYYGRRLAELRDEIKLLFDEIFEKYPRTTEYSDFEGRGRISLEFPRLWSEVKLNLPDSHLFCEVSFIRNNSSIFNYHIILVSFYRTSRPEKIWDEIKPEHKRNFTQLLNRLSNIPNLDVMEFNLPVSITSQLKKSIDTSELSERDLFVERKKKYKIISIEIDSEEQQCSDLNIFIGKNNSGKTLRLTNCFKNISYNNKTYDNHEAVHEFHQKHPQFYVYELYYVPHNRDLDEPIGRKPDIKEGLIEVLNNLRNLITNRFLKNEPVDIENRNNEIQPTTWKIPNFLEIIDIFSLDLKQTDILTREDRDIIDKGRQLFIKFNQIWEKWKHQVVLFFEDIEVREVKDLGRGGRHKITFYDNWTGKEISNWKSFGSGTQQLLNLIFIIEFLKLKPAIIYEKLLEELKEENISSAFDESVKDIYNNRIIFIDEPEVSLHPSLQRKFFNYLNESSQTLQIFVATQSPFFLDINNFDDLLTNTIYVNLCKKDETGQFTCNGITKVSRIQIIDEIFDYNPTETAFYLSKNNYYDLMITDKRDFQLHSLKMFDRLFSGRKKYDPDYKNLLNLGTFDEKYETRLIQNAIFLSVEPITINLNSKDTILKDCEKFFLYQLHNNEIECVEEKRLMATCASHWNVETSVKSKVLSYTEEQANELSTRIMEKLHKLENEGKKIIKHRSILVFPENTLPYQVLSSLINFSKEKSIIIIGGMEHIKLKKLKEYYDDFVKEYSDDFIRHPEFENIVSIPRFENCTYVNQAVVINPNGKFTFQIKNISVSKLGERIEGIPIIPKPNFLKIETSVGSLAVFICKDFLVNYEVIDKWMDKNQVKTILVPSFTQLVNPFIHKFSNIIHDRENKDITIVFVNLAEYGGSGIFNLTYERQYEPGKESPFKDREEECKSFEKELSRDF